MYFFFFFFKKKDYLIQDVNVSFNVSEIRKSNKNKNTFARV